MPLNRVNDISPYLGCDPEFFFKFNGEVIGAEKIIPKDGLIYTAGTQANDGRWTAGGDVNSKFIIDGVQAELNPRPNTCRANLANEIAACFKTLQAELKRQNKQVSVDFSRTVEISKESLMELDEKSRKFGCAPSNSIYKRTSGLKIADVDPTEYRIRAAGGHIHIGKTAGGTGLVRALTKDHEKTVAMLDILCGNTSVLIDRDEGNIERRKVYGKAGEFRLPPHGLEYRTLSNYWLTSYPLMSFAFGMARLAVQLIADEANHKEFYDEFTSAVKPKNVKNAINHNDFDLAMENFKRIEKLLKQVIGEYASDRYPIHSTTLKEFYHFVSIVQKEGMQYWFKDDPMKHWTSIDECHRGGFSDYLKGIVRTDMNKVKLAA